MSLASPRYFPRELTSLVKHNIDSMSLEKASSAYQVDRDILDEVVKGNVSFRLPHYEVISKITELTVEHLIGYDNIRCVQHDDFSYESNERMKTLGSFFNEVAMLRRI